MGQKILALDVGFVATGAAVFVQNGPTAWVPMEMLCVKPQDPGKEKKRGIYKAHLDAERVALMVRGLEQVMARHEIRHLVAELPSGGAQGARANRCMGASTAMIVTLAEARRLSAEWFTPEQTRTAALGQPTKGKADKIKPLVIAAMANRFPGFKPERYLKGHQEHIADALATFEAARNGNLVRSLSTPYGELA